MGRVYYRTRTTDFQRLAAKKLYHHSYTHNVRLQLEVWNLHYMLVWNIQAYYYESQDKNKKQLLDEVFMICRIINVEVRVTGRAKGEADNSYRDIENFAYHKNRVK